MDTSRKFTAALFAIVPNQKGPKGISRRMERLWDIHAMEFYPAIEKTRLLVHPITWVNPADMLSEGSQMQKSTRSVFRLYEVQE